MTAYVLGLSAFYHDSAACLLRDGEIVAAAEEERFSRRKGDARFPAAAAAYCLAEAGIGADQLDAVAYYDKPIQTFGRLLQSYLEYPFRGYASFRRSLPLWMKQKLKIPAVIDTHLEGFDGPIYFSRHHESHAASAFFCSPFESAAILVADGVGEWACTSIGEGKGSSLALLREVRFPHSLGLFYSAMTQYLGFAVNSDEYKVMGLAPYGEPRFLQLLLDRVVALKEDGSLALDLSYFDFPHGLSMINGRLAELLGQPARGADDAITEFHMDVAASAQALVTEAMVRLAREAKRVTGNDRLCLAGGVALNCVANGAINRTGLFRDIFVQPAAGDAGGAIGAALQTWHQVLGQPRRPAEEDAMRGAYLGPAVTAEGAARYLDSVSAAYQRFDEPELAERIAGWIAAGHIVALCRGRMEFGPRALGARSILGDPRDARNQGRINRKVKYRESFRPFAPALLQERAGDYFDLDIPSPYMLLVMPLKEERRRSQAENDAVRGLDKLRVARSDVPAVTHVDYSARIQTVSESRNGFFWRVVAAFYRRTGCPMIVNTSFNVRGEPIVRDEKDAHRCFLMTDVDILVLGNCVVPKPGVSLAPADAEAPAAASL